MMILCLGSAALAEGAPASSFDFDFSRRDDGFSRGTVVYLPDFAGTGSQWGILAVTGGDEFVQVTVTPIALSSPADAPDAVHTWEVRLVGVEAEDAFVHLELCKKSVALVEQDEKLQYIDHSGAVV